MSYHVVSDNCRDEWEAELPAPGVTMQSIVTSIVSGNSLRSRISRDRNAIGEALLPGERIVKDYVIVQVFTHYFVLKGIITENWWVSTMASSTVTSPLGAISRSLPIKLLFGDANRAPVTPGLPVPRVNRPV